MAISFSNDQISQITKSMLDIPLQISSSKDSQAAQSSGQADMKTKDDNNKVFFNNFLNIVNQYHNELVALNGNQKTAYDPSQLDKSAKQESGNIHYPITPTVWMGLKPKLHDSCVGNPVTVNTESEIYWNQEVTNEMNVFLTGWTGSVTTTSTSTYSSVTGVGVTSSSGLVVGQKVMLYSGSDGVYGTISGVSGNNIGISAIITPVGVLNSGSILVNHFSGFTNTERESGVAARQTMFNGMKPRITTRVSSYLTYLQKEQTALNANDASFPDSDEIKTAKTNVSSQITTVTTWQANPETGSGVSKWGDTKIVPFNNSRTSRSSFVATRVAQVNLRLGSVTQTSAGDYSGSAGYLKLFDWINMRINKVSGTLTQYYLSLLGGQALSEQSGGLEKQLTEYKNIFSVTKLTSDGDGTDTIHVEDVAEFMPNDKVMVLDDDSNHIDRVILSISGKDVKLNGVVSNEYKVDTTARLVKQK